MIQDKNTPHLVLVPGGWHGTWTYEMIIPLLESQGVQVHVVATPSVGGHDLRGIPADVEAVTKLLDTLGGPVVLAGHSYAGIIITQAGIHAKVDHLVYLAAFMPDENESVGALASSPPAQGEPDLSAAVEFNDDGTLISLNPALIGEIFYGQCSADISQCAIDRLQPHVAACFGQAPTHLAWKNTPSTYVLCTEDRALPPPLQMHMARHATQKIEMAADHSPFFSRPVDLAKILKQIILAMD